MSPKISVVIPSLNQGSFIEKAIESVISQRYPRFEILVIDAGSTDNTDLVIRKHSRAIGHFVSERDRGQFDAILKGLRIATGDILCWQNADDYYLPGAFARVVQEFASDSSLDLVFGATHIVDEWGRLRRVASYVKPTVPAILYYAAHIPSQSAFWTRRAMDAIRIEELDPSIQYCMEKYFFGLMLAHGATVRYLKHPLGAFREQVASKTSTRALSEGWRCEDLRVARQFEELGLVAPYSTMGAILLHLRRFALHLLQGDFEQLAHLLRQFWKWRFVSWKRST